MKKIKLLTIILLTCAFQLNAQVTIGSGDSPAKAAILDLKTQDAIDGGVTSTKGGMLLPRVQLDNLNELTPFIETTDAGYATQKPIHKGMLVYNVGTSGIGSGAYMWSGTEWLAFQAFPVIAPVITALQCGNAYIRPGILEPGVPYTGGVLIVPYTGGNGGYYSGGSPIISTDNPNLTATLQPGTLAYGSGELIFTLEGIPTSAIATFDITFLGQVCQATVSGSVLGIGETIAYYGIIAGNLSQDMSEYLTDLPMIDGLRIDLTGTPGGASGFAKIKNTTASAIVVTIAGAGASPSKSIDPNTSHQISSLSWGGSPIPLVSQIMVKINPTTYRWYEFKWAGIQATDTGIGINGKAVFLAVTRIA